MHRVICIFRVVFWMCCTASLPVKAQEHSNVTTQQVWVLSNGFHSAIALRTSDAGPLLRSVVGDPQAHWIVVGWGDRDYFMAKRATLWITLKAACWPTDSALHVIPLRKPPEAVYRSSDIVRLKLSPENAARLVSYLEAQFATDWQRRPIFIGRGFSERSAFFLGNEKFYFPKMCNWWVADGLREAGLPLSRLRSITAHELMRQVKKHGEKTGARQLPGDGF